VPDLNDILAFVAVVRHKGFTPASRALGIPKATLSRKVASLERRLGVRLLHRSTRRIAMTEAGQVYFAHCERIADDVEAADTAAASLQEAPRGTLRIHAPHAMAEALLTPLIPEFAATHPDMTIVLTLASDVTNPIEQAADVVVTGRPVVDSSFPTRVLLTSRSHLFAAPSYMARRREPKSPADLPGYRTLHMAAGTPLQTGTWYLHREGRRTHVHLSPTFVANDALPLVRTAVAGLGIVLMADLAVPHEEAAGRLLRVLPEWEGAKVQVRVLLPSRHIIPPKTRAFVDYLLSRAARFGQVSQANQGSGASQGKP